MKKIFIAALSIIFLLTITCIQSWAEDVIYGCINKTNGKLRVVSSSNECRTPELAIYWNKVGEQGPKGDKGDTGLTGPPGPQGEQGEPGTQGLIGPQGPRGEKGDTGDKGMDGEQGSSGIDGLHCWDLDENEVCDLETEDINDDSICDALDCQGVYGGGKFGDWQDGFFEDISYLADTDGFVVVYSSYSFGTPEIMIRTDSSDPPDTIRVYQMYDGATAAYGHLSVMCPVREGDFWMVTKNSGGHPLSLFIHWLPLGN